MSGNAPKKHPHLLLRSVHTRASLSIRSRRAAVRFPLPPLPQLLLAAVPVAVPFHRSHRRLPTHQCHHSRIIMSSRSDKRSSIKQTHSSKGSNSGDDQRQLRSGAVIQLPAAAQKANRPLTSQQLQQRQQAYAARAQQREAATQQRRATAQWATAVRAKHRSAAGWLSVVLSHRR